MPTYEYECKHCGHSFEISQKMTDPPLDKCPKCSHKVRRLIGTGAGIIFKGSGFYATDYRKKTKDPQRPSNPADTCRSCPKTKEGCPGQQG